jgi:hypothetical protein
VSERETRHETRAGARAYEEALPPQQRKQLGQYFTGLPLGKLLAHLALAADTHAVLDPMAGHGDLLDATFEAATESGIDLVRLDGIEVDEPTVDVCRMRLNRIVLGRNTPAKTLVAADAFDPATVTALPLAAYDLVIANPPYVRYQAGSTDSDAVRRGLGSIADAVLPSPDRDVWSELTKGYSGHADLSVPSWLLAAARVRPAGRLAIVVPATWRSRNYADVIRYLMLRCFALECIVEDKQPGWFSDALVRTHLIVARRLPAADVAVPLRERSKLPVPQWLQIAPEAAAGPSLVGAAFPGEDPERQCAAWVRNGCKEPKPGITSRAFNLQDEWAALETRIAHRPWYQRLEGHSQDLPLFVPQPLSARVVVPDALKGILPAGFSPDALVSLEQAGIRVGQGLRTGCNRFFYVTSLGPATGGAVRVEASSFLARREFSVPAAALRPVLRRQSELECVEGGTVPDGRVLDLRRWVLPEDFGAVEEARAAYRSSGEPLPEIMPDELAAYVRVAANAPPAVAGEGRIPELSAVRTNVRISRGGRTVPRFWYMLPDFAPRHSPQAFVARINQGLPWVEANLGERLLVDANFSTIWSQRDSWSPHALKALLNSIWCRAFMEAVGTSFGGGALKLEATHLRQLPVPVLSQAARGELAEAGKQLTRAANDVQSRIDAIVLDAVLAGTSSEASPAQLTRVLSERAQDLSSARQRVG